MQDHELRGVDADENDIWIYRDLLERSVGDVGVLGFDDGYLRHDVPS